MVKDKDCMNEEKPTAEELIKLKVDSLFNKYYERESSDELEIISQYFIYLAEQIDARCLRVNGRRDMITSFESVFLLLQERLFLYPETIRKQVDAIATDTGLGGTLATVANLPEEELRIARMIQRYGIFGRMSVSLFGLSMKLPKDGFGLSREKLFSVKVALSRLAQIIKFASTIEVVDHDAGFYDLKDHYNPDLIQKAKIVAMVNLVRIQVDTLPDKEISNRIIDRIDRIEKEIRKPKPRWGMILASALALLGFLADLKTIYPDVYTDSYQMVSQIVSVLYLDGSVLATKTKTLLLTEAGSGTNQPEQPKPPMNSPNDDPIALTPKKIEEEISTSHKQ